jgi:hypothetical protein
MQVPLPVVNAIWIKGAAEGTQSGMSGSPIVDDRGKAIGVFCLSYGDQDSREGGPNPELSAHLPGWMLKVR